MFLFSIDYSFVTFNSFIVSFLLRNALGLDIFRGKMFIGNTQNTHTPNPSHQPFYRFVWSYGATIRDLEERSDGCLFG